MRISDYIEEEDKVNWKKLARLKNKSDDLFGSMFDNVLEYLKEKRLASYFPEKGTYSIAEGCRINPILSDSLIPYYPKRREDAINYINAFKIWLVTPTEIIAN